jgi:hypothetical protein
MPPRSAGPLPCAPCDAYLAPLPLTLRDALARLRWFLDDHETDTGRPHRHVTEATLADRDAYKAALEQERAEAEALVRLRHDLHALVAEIVQREQATTYYLGGGPTIERTTDGGYIVSIDPADEEAQP